ncbi:hypothetical protein KK466_29265, partial [Klebsiella pneumoniae]|uniref:hypothetical protein n=1 Tax=Klebsiella pneumoniae TaxID=573 RepID=UPI001BE101B0
DLLAHFPSHDHEPIIDEIPGEMEEVRSASEQEWEMSFDGSAGGDEGGAGIVFTTSEGATLSYSYKHTSKVTNNEAEYEAMVLGLLL